MSHALRFLLIFPQYASIHFPMIYLCHLSLALFSINYHLVLLVFFCVLFCRLPGLCYVVACRWSLWPFFLDLSGQYGRMVVFGLHPTLCLFFCCKCIWGL
ncbi:uncharacterized protein BO66DRAFT_161442 [Aspergillus aculeatinus CBS 121060]|uniref:Uncharacterized protein n=1 Tax=Aspergillus aculeatinus CBS 121060 TaxID=1448322 RepID=A0ACD1GZW9_9EURO|nr:hypothetical protein BO66DRAFT_161442 [Aspergillus aculeatinus CBS 121060]RAH67021.1 hypothetical protein BO66DRAFT_161442 [Aspergillus aculeatinus CBS 121060]